MKTSINEYKEGEVYQCPTCKKMWYGMGDISKKGASIHIAEVIFLPIQGEIECPVCKNPKKWK